MTSPIPDDCVDRTWARARTVLPVLVLLPGLLGVGRLAAVSGWFALLALPVLVAAMASMVAFEVRAAGRIVVWGRRTLLGPWGDRVSFERGTLRRASGARMAGPLAAMAAVLGPVDARLAVLAMVAAFTPVVVGRLTQGGGRPTLASRAAGFAVDRLRVPAMVLGVAGVALNAARGIELRVWDALALAAGSGAAMGLRFLWRAFVRVRDQKELEHLELGGQADEFGGDVAGAVAQALLARGASSGGTELRFESLEDQFRYRVLRAGPGTSEVLESEAMPMPLRAALLAELKDLAHLEFSDSLGMRRGSLFLADGPDSLTRFDVEVVAGPFGETVVARVDPTFVAEPECCLPPGSTLH